MAINFYKEKDISELNPNDEYVCISGFPVVIKDNMLVLDDGNSTINIYLNDSKPGQEAKFLRIFGKVIQTDGNLAIQADFFQDLSKIDTFLYNKVRNLLLR